VNRRLGALACIGLASWIAGCGDGGESLVGEDGLRDCLGKHGVAFGAQSPGATGYAPLFHVAADFHGQLAGISIDVFIEKSAARARRTAADAEGALSAVGVSGPAGSVVSQRNAVVVFDRPPTAQARETVRSCMASS
jgi:hypothetical protein